MSDIAVSREQFDVISKALDDSLSVMQQAEVAVRERDDLLAVTTTQCEIIADLRAKVKDLSALIESGDAALLKGLTLEGA